MRNASRLIFSQCISIWVSNNLKRITIANCVFGKFYGAFHWYFIVLNSRKVFALFQTMACTVQPKKQIKEVSSSERKSFREAPPIQRRGKTSCHWSSIFWVDRQSCWSLKIKWIFNACHGNFSVPILIWHSSVVCASSLDRCNCNSFPGWWSNHVWQWAAECGVIAELAQITLSTRVLRVGAGHD